MTVSRGAWHSGTFLDLARRHGQFLMNALSVLFVLVSYLLWFNFSAPPINSNTGFDLYPWRQVDLAGSLFNPYVWSGSYVPAAFGVPREAFYGVFFSLSGQDYSVALLLSFVVVDVLGGLCLFYLLKVWLGRFKIRPEYGLFGVLIYAFNDYRMLSGFGTTDGYFSVAPLGAGDPAILVILSFLTFLTLFRSSQYALLLGGFSILAFSSFPIGTLTLTEEYLVVFVLLLGFAWGSLQNLGIRKRLTRVSRKAILTLATLVAANAYLIYPLILVGGAFTHDLATSNQTIAFSYAFDVNETFPNSLRLITNWSVFTNHSPPWAVAYLAEPASVLLSFVLPLFALASVWFLRRISDVLLYALMLIVLCLSTSINSPIGPAFIWFTFNIAPLGAFYNGESFTPAVLLLYCIFVPVTVERIVRRFRDPLWLGLTRPSRTPQPLYPRVSMVSRGSSRVLLHSIWPVFLAVVLLASVYPALTPAYTQDAADNFPLSSSLPPSYSHANAYLQTTNPNGPVMVFPQVQPFDSNAVNGSTWYYGVDIYPTLIPNPSISSPYPPNYHGEDGVTIPPAGFVYQIGGSVCAKSSCTEGGLTPIPQQSALISNASIDYSTSIASQVNWEATLPSDNRTFVQSNGSTSIDFQVNSSVPESNGHWLIGFLPSYENLSTYSYALISYNLTGASSESIQFGFHSFTQYGSGSGYYIGNFTLLNSAPVRTVLVPLATPSLQEEGSLNNVTNLFFVDDSHSTSGSVDLTIHSLRFVRSVSQYAPVWRAGTSEDTANLTSNDGQTDLHFSINGSVFEPNGHWAVGLFDEPTNLSGYDYAVLNYSLSGVNPTYLQFGYHSGTNYGFGNGFILSRYLTLDSGGQFTTLIPLASPTLLDGGSLANVTNFFLAYTPPAPQPGFGYVNITSLRLTHSDPDKGRALASALDRLGIEFAYVDTSVVLADYPLFSGAYYNQVFQASPFFPEVFHSGSITIYRNLLYTGLFSSPQQIQPEVPMNATLQGLDFPLAGVYYNSSNSGTSYIPPSAIGGVGEISQANLSDAIVVSATQYTVEVHASSPSIIDFLTQFDSAWYAELPNGSVLSNHFEVDGFSNGWYLPPGEYRLTIAFSGSQTYSIVETVCLAIPPGMVVGFLILRYRTHSRQRGAPDRTAPDSMARPP